MSDIWTRVTNISVHFSHHTDMLVTVEEGVFFIPGTRPAAMRCLVSLEARVGEDDDKSLGVFIEGRDGDMLFSYQLRKLGRRAGLCS